MRAWYDAVDEQGLDVVLSNGIVSPAATHPTSDGDVLIILPMVLSNTLSLPSGSISVTTISKEEAAEKYEDGAGRNDLLTNAIRKNLIASEGLPMSV